MSFVICVLLGSCLFLFLCADYDYSMRMVF